MPAADALVVDTHALLWWLAGSDRLSSTAGRALEAAEAVLVSPISCWEVAMLTAKERVALDRPVATWVADLVGSGGPAEVAELTPQVAVTAGLLADFHGDPADRLIFATAQTLGVPLVSKDRRLHEAGGRERVDVVW